MQGKEIEGEIPRYVVCFFNGYFAPGDLPGRLRPAEMQVIGRKKVGVPLAGELLGRFAPRIGFDGEVVLLRRLEEEISTRESRPGRYGAS